MVNIAHEVSAVCFLPFQGSFSGGGGSWWTARSWLMHAPFYVLTAGRGQVHHQADLHCKVMVIECSVSWAFGNVRFFHLLGCLPSLRPPALQPSCSPGPCTCPA